MEWNRAKHDILTVSLKFTNIWRKILLLTEDIFLELFFLILYAKCIQINYLFAACILCLTWLFFYFFFHLCIHFVSYSTYFRAVWENTYSFMKLIGLFLVLYGIDCHIGDKRRFWHWMIITYRIGRSRKWKNSVVNVFGWPIFWFDSFQKYLFPLFLYHPYIW